jgi:oligopeptide/dipeptide ABC transporter ATP-binding protein
MSDGWLLEVNDLTKHFPVLGGVLQRPLAWVRAVDGVSLRLSHGEVLGVVGESGCGKSTLVRVILRLMPPTAGEVRFEGQDVFRLGRADLRRLRQNMQIVFQDPYWSLDPRWTVRDIVAEPLRAHLRLGRSELTRRVGELLEVVGLPAAHAERYPHEFSGGQRQRIAVARALALRPRLVVLDEPTSSIDTLSQAQILNLVRELRRQFNLSYILVSHDLAVVNYLADRVMVMYLGEVVETAPRRLIFDRPAHPYTQILLEAIPRADPGAPPPRVTLKGSVPSAINPPPGCRFHTRCPAAQDRCRAERPDLVEVSPGHLAACHFAGVGLRVV